MRIRGRTLRSLSNPALTEVRERWYPADVKVVPSDVLLTPLTCFHWFIGDGSNHGGSGLRLHTEGFSMADVEMLVELMRAVGLLARPRRRSASHGSGQRLPYIVMRTSEGLDFLDYIGPCSLSDYAHRWDRGKRRDYTTNPRGSAHGRAILTEAIVTLCRCRYALGETPTALAREFGVNPVTMSAAIRGETWTSVPLLTGPC